jgi:integrase
MAKLTSAAVERYRPTAKRREIRDDGAQGLYLVIQSSGAKSWALRFRRPGGAPAKLTLGTVDLSGRELEGQPEIGMPLSLPAARQLAAEVHRRRALGHDVIADHAAAKHRHRTEVEEGAANAFGPLGRRFIDEHARPKTRRWRDTARLLGLRYPKADGEPSVIKGGLAERWADKPVREIDGHDIWSATDEARRLGIPGLERRNDGPRDSRARALLSALSTAFGWFAEHRLVDSNPCTSVHRPDAPRARDRVLSDPEIVKFWAACDEAVGEPFGQLLKLLLLTGCRLAEVARMTRSELSEDGANWNIPGARTKNHRPHLVPLAPLARDMLKSVKPIAGDLVFTTTGRTPVCVGSKIKNRLDAAMKIPLWRLHDLRRTAATGMAELGIAPHIVEAALNHISGSKAGVAGTYNRAAYAPEKKIALERWSVHVVGLVFGKPANVVTLPARKKGK